MSDVVDAPAHDARTPIASERPDGDGSLRDFDSTRHLSAASRRRWIKMGVIGAAVLIVAAVAVHYYFYAIAHESTNDAFIEGNIISMSPKLASYVTGLHIDDNRRVKQGDLLVELDPRDFEARLAHARANLAAAIAKHHSAEINVKVVDTTSGAGVDQANAALEAARRQLEETRSRMEQARAQVAAAQAEATRADEDAQRYERLLKYHAVARQERDNAVAADQAATANLDATRQAQQAVADSSQRAQAQLGEAKARLSSAKAAPNRVAFSRAQVATSAAEIAQAEAEVRQAELNLSYTKIYAPQNGKITRKNVELGNYVQVGQTLFSIVPDRCWVIANFKETQLRHMRPGQPVTIAVDAYPDKEFHGHVDSIQAGSGARFSLLPPENATGNYVKVVQRVPVKIVFDDPPDPSYPLGPGMSVEPVVKVR